MTGYFSMIIIMTKRGKEGKYYTCKNTMENGEVITTLRNG